MARKSRWGTQPEPLRTTAPDIFNAWVYARLSDKNNRSEDSIETQISYCKNYIASQSDLIYQGSFEDVGYTGTNFNRPQFGEMMKGIISGEIKCIIVKDLSRVGRTYIDVGELIFDTFLQFGVRFISVNDNYDSFAPDAGRKKLLVLVKNLKNSQYSKDLSQKIKSVTSMNQKNGKLNGGVPPYGYWHTEGRRGYQIVPEAAEIVKMIFDFYADGMGIVRIAGHLNAENFPTPRYHYYLLGLQKESSKTNCRTWIPSTVSGILKNEAYTGCLVQGKKEKTADGRKINVPKKDWFIHPDTHPAIISKDLFDTVQSTLAANFDRFKQTGERHDENIFIGKIFCSRCGRAVIRDTHVNRYNKKKIYPTYYCRYCLPELKRANGISGKSMELRLADLETIVLRELSTRMEICFEIDDLLEEITNSAPITDKRRTLMAERERLEKDSAKADGLLTSAYKHLLSGLLDEAEYSAAREKFENDKQKAQIQLLRIKTQIAVYDTDRAKESDCLINFRKYRGFERLNKSIIGAFIHRIDITPLTNDILITFNFNDGFDNLMRLREESGVRHNEC